jgi:S-methylmethionine-dependent homocysteine/selenocysteine methylase
MALNNFNIFSWAKKIGRPLILNGAIGSLLQQRGNISPDSLWASAANIEQRDLVIEIHKDYIQAGADIITTNTFRTNLSAIKLSNKDFNINKLVKEGVSAAQEAKGDLPVLIAGSNAPAEDCYQAERKISINELIENHQLQISLLNEYGCNFILNETQSHFDEIKIICEYCNRNKFDFVVSLFFTNKLKLLSGEYLFKTVDFIRKYNPLAIGFNCVMPKTFLKILNKIPNDINWGFYLNCGKSNYNRLSIVCATDETEYLEIVKKALPYEPSFVGSCCCSNPNHTKSIKKYFDGLPGN